MNAVHVITVNTRQSLTLHRILLVVLIGYLRALKTSTSHTHTHRRALLLSTKIHQGLTYIIGLKQPVASMNKLFIISRNIQYRVKHEFVVYKVDRCACVQPEECLFLSDLSITHTLSIHKNTGFAFGREKS